MDGLGSTHSLWETNCLPALDGVVVAILTTETVLERQLNVIV